MKEKIVPIPLVSGNLHEKKYSQVSPEI